MELVKMKNTSHTKKRGELICSGSSRSSFLQLSCYFCCKSGKNGSLEGQEAPAPHVAIVVLF
jgi:hypothetical protein